VLLATGADAAGRRGPVETRGRSGRLEPVAATARC